MIEQAERRAIVAKFQQNTFDTGSTKVQVALLTQTINTIMVHLKSKKKDFSALYGLKKRVARRKKLLSYLLRHNPAEYFQLIAELGIRG